MIRIKYIAKRALNGHAIGDPVTLTFSAVEPMAPGRRVTRDTQKSLSGRRETLLHNAVRVWNITTEPMSLARLDALEEFLQAVEDGSQFDFEPFWTYGAAPAATNSAETRLRTAPTVRCVLGSEQYDLQHFVGHQNGGADDEWQVSFTVEEAV